MRRQSQHHIIVKAVQTSFVIELTINLRSASTHSPHDWFKTFARVVLRNEGACDAKLYYSAV